MIVLVTGGRNYGGRERVDEVLGLIHREVGITRLVNGGATGADRLSSFWATKFGVPLTEIFANWHLYGDKAGRIRNNQMLVECRPDVVVYFPGGAGTSHMRSISRKARIPLIDATEDLQEIVTQIRQIHQGSHHVQA